MLRIVYNGVELDVDQRSDMFLSYQANNLTELGSRQDTFNNTWELPMTATNRRAFGLIEQVYGEQRAATQLVPCQVYVDRTLLVDGIARVAEVRLNKYFLEVTGAISDLATALDNLDTDNIILSTFSAPNVGNATVPKLIAYPLVANNSTFNLVVETNTADAGIYPWANLRLLAHRMIEEAGYSVADEPADDIQLRTYIGGRTNYWNQYILDQPESFIIVPGAKTEPASNVTLDLQPTLNNAFTGTNQYNAPNSSVWLRVNLSLKVAIEGAIIYTLQVRVKSNLRTLLQYDITDFPPASLTISENADLYILPNEIIQIEYSVSNVASFTVLPDSTFNITPIDYITPGGNISLRCITTATPREIVLDYCNRFGKLLTVDYSTKAARFTDIKNLSNTSNGVDWSDKVVTPKELIFAGAYQSEFTYGTLATRNVYRNANDVGNGVIISNILTAENEKEVYSSFANSLTGPGTGRTFPFFSSFQLPNAFVPKDGVTWRFYRFGMTINSGDIIMGAGNTGFFRALVNSPASPPGTTSPADWQPLLFSEVYEAFGQTETYIAYLTTEAVPNVPPYDLIPPTPAIFWEFGGAGSSTSVFYPEYNRIWWPTLLTTYQLPIVQALLNPRVDKFEIDLSVADVSNLDFSRPIIIDGRAYYLNLVDQFDPIYNLPTPCELVQLAQS